MRYLTDRELIDRTVTNVKLHLGYAALHTDAGVCLLFSNACQAKGCLSLIVPCDESHLLSLNDAVHLGLSTQDELDQYNANRMAAVKRGHAMELTHLIEMYPDVAEAALAKLKLKQEAGS